MPNTSRAPPASLHSFDRRRLACPACPHRFSRGAVAHPSLDQLFSSVRTSLPLYANTAVPPPRLPTLVRPSPLPTPPPVCKPQHASRMSHTAASQVEWRRQRQQQSAGLQAGCVREWPPVPPLVAGLFRRCRSRLHCRRLRRSGGGSSGCSGKEGSDRPRVCRRCFVLLLPLGLLLGGFTCWAWGVGHVGWGWLQHLCVGGASVLHHLGPPLPCSMSPYPVRPVYSPGASPPAPSPPFSLAPPPPAGAAAWLCRTSRRPMSCRRLADDLLGV